MKPSIVVLFGAVTTFVCYAAFRPLKPEKRTADSALIVKGTVKKVQLLYDASPTKGVGQVDGGYFGARSVAVVDIEEIWKRPDKQSHFVPNPGQKTSFPLQILVPCDFLFHESPSDLTAGTTYILFLEEMGWNLYRPLDPASTHVVHNGRVAKFGINIPPDKGFGTRSVPISEFRTQVEAHLKP